MKDLSVLKALLLQEMDEAEKCNECGGLMEKGMCTECGYMEELTKGQEKIDVAEPKGEITADDFEALRNMKKEDHEVGMAQNSLESIIKSAMELKAKLGDDERNIPGWIQDHITNAENYIDQAAQGFHELDSHDQEHDMDELPDGTEELPAGDEEDMTLQGLMEKLLEAKKKPSAGLTKKQKSAISKKAKAGKDIGKKGKGFEMVAKKAAEKYGSKERGEKVAAAAMWKSAAKKAMKEDASDWEEGFEWMDELPKQYGNWKIDVAEDSIKFDDQPIVWYYKGDENGYRVVYTPNDYYSTDITLYTPGQDMYDSETDGITLQSIELGDKLDNFSFEKYAKYGARAIAKAEQMIQKAGK